MSCINRSKWCIRLVVAITFSLLVAFSSNMLAFANQTLVQLSSDPFTNKSSQHQTEVEPDSYSFGNTIVAAFQVGRFTTGGSSDIGWATSTDGGTSWTHGFLQGITVYSGGPWSRASDPSVVYNAKFHSWMISSLVFDTFAPFNNGVVTSLSTDGGLTWSQPVTVVHSTKLGFDKNWITCDNTAASPFFGSCYTEWDTFVNNKFFNLISMSTSKDGGLTWQAAKHPANNANGIGGQPVAQPDGTVIVPIIGEPTSKTVNISSFRSTDGGASWSATIVVSSLNQYIEKAKIRNGGLPSAAIDGAGQVYVTWQDCRFEAGCSANDIVITTSTNGLTWSAVHRIPIDPRGSGVDHFTPGLGVDMTTSGNNAHLALAYYYFSNASCSTSSCQLFVGFISSVNGGTSWSQKVQLAGPMKLKWLAFAFGYFAGDYIATSFVPNGQAFPVFAVASPPSAGHLNEAMFTTTGDSLQVTGGNITSVDNQVVASSPSHVVTSSAF